MRRERHRHQISFFHIISYHIKLCLCRRGILMKRNSNPIYIAITRAHTHTHTHPIIRWWKFVENVIDVIQVNSQLIIINKVNAHWWWRPHHGQYTITFLFVSQHVLQSAQNHSWMKLSNINWSLFHHIFSWNKSVKFIFIWMVTKPKQMTTVRRNG